ncbi:MAG TPA: hypothetical protein PLA80_06880, partial [Synergistaceae bacterium]|nr:hypothetical protein [Synergistaceae bacterium]
WRKSARGLSGISRNTAGGELHPAPRTGAHMIDPEKGTVKPEEGKKHVVSEKKGEKRSIYGINLDF